MEILLVEDDQLLAQSLCHSLRYHYSVRQTPSVRQARQWLAECEFGLCLLDLQLADGDGQVLCHWSNRQQLPVVVISALADISIKLSCFRQGAVDYIVKPFALAELQARIRVHWPERPPASAVVIKLADLKIDLVQHRFTTSSGDAECWQPLTRLECQLLTALAHRRCQLVRQTELLDCLWPRGGSPAQLDSLLYRLRRKLSHGRADHWLENVYGVGYRLNLSAGQDV